MILSLHFKLLQSAVLLLTTSSCAFKSAILVDKSRHTLHRKNANYHTLYSEYARTIALHSSLPNNEGDDLGDELKEDIIPPYVLSSNSTPGPSSSSSAASPRQLDPLFLAVTKMDPQTQRAERMSVPMWGELVLDRSLFVFLPIAIFALGGILLSLYVLLNSSDTFVNAIIDAATKQSIPTSSSFPDSDSCRGLCSSQSQDLEGLRSYMNRLGGK